MNEQPPPPPKPCGFPLSIEAALQRISEQIDWQNRHWLDDSPAKVVYGLHEEQWRTIEEALSYLDRYQHTDSVHKATLDDVRRLIDSIWGDQ